MKKLVLALVVIASPAIAQQAQPSASDRIALRIGGMTIQIENQQDQIRALSDELAKAQAKIKELEPKPEAEAKPVR